LLLLLLLAHNNNNNNHCGGAGTNYTSSHSGPSSLVPADLQETNALVRFGFRDLFFFSLP
jgi:hypothetical protein